MKSQLTSNDKYSCVDRSRSSRKSSLNSHVAISVAEAGGSCVTPSSNQGLTVVQNESEDKE